MSLRGLQSVIGGVVVAAVVTALSTYFYWLQVKPRKKQLGKRGITLRSADDLIAFGENGLKNKALRLLIGPFVTAVKVINPTEPPRIPLRIGKLHTLTEVDLSNCGLTCFPEALLQLKFLKSLSLGSNKLTLVPTEIGKLRNLENLDLGKNAIFCLPSTIGDLVNLRSLNLMANELEVVPEEIGNLKKVFRLGLKSNKIKFLPASIGDMEGLVELFLTDNKLESLPSTMANLSKLFKFQASFNQLKSLPSEMGSLPNLELFRVAVNRLPSVPPSFAGLNKLAWFSLAGNPACAPVPPPQLEIATICESDLEVGVKLGDGASGVVYLALWNGRQVAYKQFKSDTSPDGHCSDEIGVTCALNHPSLIKVLAIVESPAGLVMELLPGKAMAEKPNFDSLLRCRWTAGEQFESAFVVKVAVRVSEALSYLHSNRICHGDVYAHNIVCDDSGEAVLCDYGASFCYDGSMGALYEAHEVRAFGLFLNDLLQRMVCSSAMVDSQVKRPLQTLVNSCTNMPAARRLGFADVLRVLDSIVADMVQ